MIESRLRVIYGDTDQMGVVYYANYFRYFEFGRSEYFRAQGGSYRELEKEGAFLPVVEASCSYKASARYDDVIRIETTVEELRRVSLTFSYRILRDETQELLCTGKTIHACVDRTGRPVRFPEKLSSLFASVTPKR